MKRMLWRGIALGVAICLALAMLVPLLPTATVEATGYPCAFFGTASVDGALVGSGTVITAWEGANQIGQTTTGSGGVVNPYDYLLAANGNTTTISFKIGNLWAGQTAVLVMFGAIQLNLTAFTAPILQVEVVTKMGSTPQDSFCVCQNFTVEAKVSNVGGVAAVGVWANITWSPGGACNNLTGSNPQSLVNIPKDSNTTAIWTLHCNGAGNATITVNAWASNAATVNGTKNISQYNRALLGVVISAPPSGEYEVGHNFTVNATVSNLAAAPGKTAENVVANITFAAGMEFDPGHPGQGNMTLGSLALGASQNITWYLDCKAAGLGDVIVVSASGGDGGGGITSDAKTVTIDQYNHAVLAVVITGPVITEYYIGGNFTVTATVSNTAAFPAKAAGGVVANITFAASMEFNPDYPGQGNITLGSIAAGASQNVTWYLRCKAAGSGNVTVAVSGDDGYGGTTSDSKSIIIDQIAGVALKTGVNMFTYYGNNTALPAALTNIGPGGQGVALIIWTQGEWTGGEWWFYLVPWNVGPLTQLVNGRPYIIVVTANCDWIFA